MTGNTFLSFCKAVQTMEKSYQNSDKKEICKKYLSGLENETSLKLAVQFLGEGAFPKASGKRIVIGSRTISTLAADICEIDYEQVFKPCRKICSSVSETIEKLFENIPEARAKITSKELTLRDIGHYFEKLNRASNRKQKQEILRRAWSRMSPLEVRMFIQLIKNRLLKAVFGLDDIIASIAEISNQDFEAVRYAHVITGSLGEAAILAKNDRLQEASIRLLNPMPFMLASALKDNNDFDFDDYVAEPLLPGLRCQIQICAGRIELFSRHHKNISADFPEIIEFYKHKNVPDVILDGIICVAENESIFPIHYLHKRINSNAPTKQLIADYPAMLIAHDILHVDGKSLFEEQFLTRRKILEEFSATHHLPITSQYELQNHDDLNRLVERAAKNQNSGVILKKKTAVYHYGERSQSWLKVKKGGRFIKTVLMYAHKKDRLKDEFTHFTLGISVKNDNRFAEEYIPIGKTENNLPENVQAEIISSIKELLAERFGTTWALIPKIVVELEFKALVSNKRTKAGYSLQTLQIKNIYTNKPFTEIETLERVEDLYKAELEIERSSEEENFTFIIFD